LSAIYEINVNFARKSILTMFRPNLHPYSAPTLECYKYDIEQGFAFSLENPEVDTEQDW
jgi:hypothetical protein